MNEQSTLKKYSFFNKAAIISLVVLMYTTSLTTPILGIIAKAFPDASLNTVKLISTLPNLVMVVVSLIVGQVERFIGKKTLIYFAMCSLFVGLIPAFFGNITLIIITRVFVGIAFGVIGPLGSALIAEFFEGKERAAMLGYRNSLGAFCGIVFQTYAGMVGVVNWRYAFLGFLVIIPVFVLILTKLPALEKKTESGAAAAKAPRAKLNSKSIFISFMNLLFYVIMYAFMTNVAIVLISDNIGNSAQAGYVLTMFSGTAFFSSMFYGKISQVLKKYTMSLALLLICGSFIILLKGTTLAAFLAGGAVFGLGFGLTQPDFIKKVATSAPKSAVTSAMGLLTACGGIGGFSSAYVLSFVTGIFGITGVRGPWIITSVCFFAAFVLYTIVVTVIKSKDTSELA